MKLLIISPLQKRESGQTGPLSYVSRLPGKVACLWCGQKHIRQPIYSLLLVSYVTYVIYNIMLYYVMLNNYNIIHKS